MVLFPHQMPSAFALGLSWPLLDPKSGTTGTPKQTPNLTPKQQKMDQQMSPKSGQHLERPGLVLVSSWAILDQPRATWSYLGAILGSYWAMLGCLGPSWSQPGTSLGPAWARLGRPGASLGSSGATWGQLGLVWPFLEPFCRHFGDIWKAF